MLSAAHTLISLPLGIYLTNPWVSFGAAFLVHLFADTLLHWNIYPQNYPRFPFGRVAIDVGGGLAAAYLLLGNNLFTIPILAAVVGGNLPDILHSWWIILGGERRPDAWPKPVAAFFAFHHNIQRETPHFTRGLTSQIILVTIAVLATLAR